MLLLFHGKKMLVIISNFRARWGASGAL